MHLKWLATIWATTSSALVIKEPLNKPMKLQIWHNRKQINKTSCLNFNSSALSLFTIWCGTDLMLRKLMTISTTNELVLWYVWQIFAFRRWHHQLMFGNDVFMCGKTFACHAFFEMSSPKLHLFRAVVAHAAGTLYTCMHNSIEMERTDQPYRINWVSTSIDCWN